MTEVIAICCLIGSPLQVDDNPETDERVLRDQGLVVVRLLDDDLVRSDLDLVTEQIEDLQSAEADYMREGRAIIRRLNREIGFPPHESREDEYRAARQVAMNRLDGRLFAKLDQILTPHQRERLNQLILQSYGVHAFAHEFVSQQLELTRNQVESITQILTKFDDFKAGDPFGGHQPQQREVVQAEREAIELMLAVLSSGQRREFTELLGVPLRIQMNRGVFVLD